MSTVVIDELIKDYDQCRVRLETDEPSVFQNVSVHLTKILILTCTSYYEEQLQQSYVNYVKALSDMYADKPHRFDLSKKEKSVYQRFNFGEINKPDSQNSLPELKRFLEPLHFFGDKFSKKIIQELVGNDEKEREVKAFQEMFVMRNFIAHQMYVGFSNGSIRGKSFEEIKRLHYEAIKFVNYFTAQFVIQSRPGA